MGTTTQIDDIKGATDEVIVRGHVIQIHEVTMNELKSFVQCCAPFLSAFDEAAVLAVEKNKAPEEFALFKLLSLHSDAFMDAVELVSNVDLAFLRRLKPDEFYVIAAKMVEVNGAFFVRALVPALVKIVQVMNTVGLMLSKSSLPTDTVAPKS